MRRPTMIRNVARLVFGDPVHNRLSKRVRRAIAGQQNQGEILVGWVQLCLVIFFLALYTVAPKTSEGTIFTPVPYVLAFYFLVTVLRLILAYVWELPRWLLLVSVLVDIGLLMALIWSFHVQYEQPAPFYLKAPTLLYVFIFISLRTLRFDPTFVLAAGVAAAGGWMAMVWYAVRQPSIGDVITRDYVDYLTSNQVLIGAEIDKVLSILLVTAILAVALVRGRRLLIRAVIDATAAQDLSRFVAPEVADHITSAERPIQPGDGEVKEASVLFCDIERFSAIAERLPPDRVMHLLNDYFDTVSDVIGRHGGIISQYQGDAMLITFNTARPDQAHAANALRTAVGIQRALAGRQFGDGEVLKARCGINTGQMISGAIGTHDRLLFTVHGDEVNIAARLEALNKDYGTYILASEQTVRAAGHEFAHRAIGVVPVRGRETPVTVYTIATDQELSRKVSTK